MNINLEGKVALVTGGSRGIGAAIVEQLAASGAKVALHYGNSKSAAEEVQTKFPKQVVLFQEDLSNVKAAVKLVDKVVQQMNRLDILVNNAGIAIKSPLLQDDYAWMEDWQKTMQVNLNAAAVLCKSAIPYFQRKGGGRIINIASRAAHRGDTEDYLAYAASKGGLVAFSKSIARAFGKDKIKAFVVSPGFVQTDMAQDFVDLYGTDYIKNDIPLGEVAQPADLAPMVVFLASGFADHATGTTIHVNGGSYVS